MRKPFVVVTNSNILFKNSSSSSDLLYQTNSIENAQVFDIYLSFGSF